MALGNLRIVLVRAENSINIGQVARVMKNFGVSDLALVRCAPHRVSEAYMPGWKAKHLINAAKSFRSMSRSFSGSVLTIGFTTRNGRWRGEPRLFPELVPEILQATREGKVSLVFGNERNGLSTQELRKCDLVARIPANPKYASLNLSHAVAVSLFGIFCAMQKKAPGRFKKPEKFFARTDEFEDLMRRFRKLLFGLGYGGSKREDLLGRTEEGIRGYFRKSTLERRELHLFQALLERIQHQIKRESTHPARNSLK